MLRDMILDILKKHNIANLARESIASELMAAIEEARGHTSKSSDEWERIYAEGEAQIHAQIAMLNRLETALGITPSGRPEWDTIARFLIEKEKSGETIESFAANCKLDPYNTPKAHQLAKDPTLIKANWKHVIAVNAPKDYTLGLPEVEPPEIKPPAPLTAIEEAWQRVLGQVMNDAPRAITWITETAPIDYKDGIFKVLAPNAFARDWLEQRLTSTVNRLLAGILNNPDVEVEFVEEER